MLHERVPGRADPAGGDVGLGDAEALELVLREVDAPEAPVLGDVAHDVDLLEREPERLGARRGGDRVARLVDGGAREPDGARDAAAVLAELLPAGVPRLLRVHEPARDEVEGALRGTG